MLEAVLGFIGHVLRSLAFSTVFYAIGTVVLKVLTLGRYPRLRKLPEDARTGFMVSEAVSLFGMLVTVGSVMLVVVGT